MIDIAVSPFNGDPKHRQVVRATRDGALIHEDFLCVSSAFMRTNFLDALARKLGVEFEQVAGLHMELCEAAGGNDKPPAPLPVSAGALIERNPYLHPPVIDGLLRRGETANLIASPKVGKSWLSYGLALSLVTGQPWLGRFPCRVGRVLLIDNELHRPTISSRLAFVAKQLGLDDAEWHGEIDVLPLRGLDYDLPAICNTIMPAIERGTYSLVVLDAWYRCLPEGTSENDNAAVMRLYNLIDHAAEQQQCAWINIHHASKGSQTEKTVTDVGAGAGSQSRAADAHIVIRPHEDEGVYVLDAAVRSFPPVAPLALNWEYPLWQAADGVDTSLLAGRLTRADQKAADKDREGMDAILEALRAAGEPLTLRRLMASTKAGQTRLERLLYRLERDGHITTSEAVVRGNICTKYALKMDV